MFENAGNKFQGPYRRAAWVLAWCAFIVSCAGFATSAARALPPGTAPAAAIVLTPSNGDSGTTFAMAIDGGLEARRCPGDGIAGFRWAGFITPVSNDPATLRYNDPGSFPNATLAPGSLALQTTAQAFVVAQVPGPGTGAVIAPSLLSFQSPILFSRDTLMPGDYWIGLACYDLNDGTNTAKYWSTRIKVTDAAGAGPNNFTWAVDATTADTTTSTTTTTVADATTTTIAGGTTTTTVAGGTTTTTVAGATTTTVAGSTVPSVSPASPAPGGAYTVTYPNCEVGETITFTQSASTPASVSSVCAASSALTDGDAQALTTGVATGSFTAAPIAAGSYTVVMKGTVSPERTITFVVAAAATPVGGSGGGDFGTTAGGSTFNTSGGTIPSTGSSTTSLIVWGVLLLVFGRMAILLGRKPRVTAVR